MEEHKIGFRKTVGYLAFVGGIFVMVAALLLSERLHPSFGFVGLGLLGAGIWLAFYSPGESMAPTIQGDAVPLGSKDQAPEVDASGAPIDGGGFDGGGDGG